jgi:hypothetical protein
VPEVSLETPSSFDDLYLARGAELIEFQLRPAFTGDVYRVDNRLVALVQHPCAMRRGADLVERLLVAEVVLNRGGIPGNWSKGSFKKMFLPDLLEEHQAIAFDELGVLSSAQIVSAERVAILSNIGVNLLVQRWLFHNSRVVIPTMTIGAQSIGPFDEADLIQDGCVELTEAGIDLLEANQLIDEWFSLSHGDGQVPRRTMLSNAQQRSVVRSTFRRQLRVWVSDHVGSRD